MRNFSFIILILLSICGYGQAKKHNNELSKMTGVLLFLGNEKEVYTMYFKESTITDLSSLLKKKDTIEVYTLGSPGDDASDIEGFKLYLDKVVHFKKLTLKISQDNYKGQQYEDTFTPYSKFGSINYFKNRRYQLSRTYMKVTYGDRVVVLVLREYIQIEAFLSNSDPTSVHRAFLLRSGRQAKESPLIAFRFIQVQSINQ